jgi:hypothetical protein
VLDVGQTLSGLSRNLTGLPPDLLRAAWCISARPNNRDTANLAIWYHNFFIIPRYSGNEDLKRIPLKFANRGKQGQSSFGGSNSSNLTNSSPGARITNSSANYVIPIFSLPPTQRLKNGLCAGASADVGAIWTGIDANINDDTLLQAGIIMTLTCNYASYPPLTQLAFFGEFLPAEQEAVMIPFPVQIQSNDNVYTGVYWSPDPDGNPAIPMYNYIDNTKSIGRQYADPNKGEVLIPNAALAVGEPPTIGNSVVAVFPALPKEQFQFISTVATVDATGKTTYPIGTTFTIKGGGTTTQFTGVRLYMDLPLGGNPATTNVVGTYNEASKITGFKLELVN